MMPIWAMNLPWGHITNIASSNNLSPHIVAAIVQQESGGRTWAFRFEPSFNYFSDVEKWAKQLGISQESEKTAQAMSFGLMQIMGATARYRGFSGLLTSLCDPIIGLSYGCQHLSALFKKYSAADKAIAAYNAGSPRVGGDGKFVNQSYVDSVLKYFTDLSPSV